eukprot:TRINITY_DN6944_c1_g1_i5.p1 TRINITY_DN6944_c1_g1~~TRINITY_DN6944_c1_g1_i5.p1  ORF type:complete len:115 (-),score=22.23 TRINITY_DN6944_c1_g1_i5:114-458(-)
MLPSYTPAEALEWKDDNEARNNQRKIVCNRLRRNNSVRRSYDDEIDSMTFDMGWLADMLHKRRREKKFREKTRFRWHVYVDVKISSDDEWFFTDDSGFEEGFIQEGGDCDRMFF